jgi:hypothetical protein
MSVERSAASPLSTPAPPPAEDDKAEDKDKDKDDVPALLVSSGHKRGRGHESRPRPQAARQSYVASNNDGNGNAAAAASVVVGLPERLNQASFFTQHPHLSFAARNCKRPSKPKANSSGSAVFRKKPNDGRNAAVLGGANRVSTSSATGGSSKTKGTGSMGEELLAITTTCSLLSPLVCGYLFIDTIPYSRSTTRTRTLHFQLTKSGC